MGQPRNKENTKPAAEEAPYVKRKSGKAPQASQQASQKRQRSSELLRNAQPRRDDPSLASQELDDFCTSLRLARVQSASRSSRHEVTTFDQVATANNPTPSPDLDSVLGSFFQGLSNGPTTSATNSNSLLSCDTRVTQKAPAARKQSSSLPTTEGPQTGRQSLQMDWSLKSVVRVSSEEPLLCCQAAASAKPSTVCTALHHFASGTSPAPGSAEHMLNALTSWQYPDTTLDAAAVRALSSSKACADVMSQRKRVWEDAFRCLVGAVRSCSCDAFYFIPAPGSRRSFVAFFGAAGTGGRPKMHAWLSHSTRGLRALLRTPPHGMAFSMPLASGLDALESYSLEGGRSSSGAGKDDAARLVDGTCASLLLFQGAVAVQGLFDFLLTDSTGEGTPDVDVPCLLAPVPFPGASLHQLHPQMLAGAQSGRTADGGSSRMEVRGRVPAWCLHRMARVLQHAHAHAFQMVMETESLTAAFNLDADQEAVSSAASQLGLSRDEPARRSCMDAAESLARQIPAGSLAGLVMRKITCRDSLFTARLVSLTATD